MKLPVVIRNEELKVRDPLRLKTDDFFTARKQPLNPRFTQPLPDRFFPVFFDALFQACLSTLTA